MRKGNRDKETWGKETRGGKGGERGKGRREKRERKGRKEKREGKERKERKEGDIGTEARDIEGEFFTILQRGEFLT